MTAPAMALRSAARAEPGWLWNRRWDLTWISLSVVLVTVPYLLYLALLEIQPILQPLVRSFGGDVESISRNGVNALVALAVGGPHMYATFSRTALDTDFVKKHPRLVWSSLLIPLVVVALAFFNLPLLLTLFFFWASLHVLHQILYIVELYNHRAPTKLTRLSHLSDYAVVLTSLYPLAAVRIANGTFAIGTSNLSEVIGSIFPLGPWMVWVAGGMFAVALVVWLVKSAIEAARGDLHFPKVVFIGLTVVASFFVPILPNLDTAFQGMNLWHSLQYLALTWMLNNLRVQRGELDRSPFVKRMSVSGSSRRYYLFNIGLTIADFLLALVIFVGIRYGLGQTFDFAFDRAYYIAILSFLWIHYYHDHYLFTQPQVIDSRETAPAPA
ncbi:MAG: hypothetical protein WD906_08090 [Anaerolineales bacterium]